MTATTVRAFSSQAGLATFTTSASSSAGCPRRSIDSTPCALAHGHDGRCTDSAGTQVWGPAHVLGGTR